MPASNECGDVGSDSDDPKKTTGTSRRAYLAAAGGAGTVALTGCLGGSDGGGGTETDSGEADGTTTDASGGDETITVGFALPEEGSYATLTGYLVNGFQLRIDHELGGELDGNEVEYVSRDTETNPSAGVSAARELIQQEDVDILAGPISSAVMNAMISEVRGEDVVWLNVHAGDPLIVQDGCLENQYNPSLNLWTTSYPMGQWVYDNVAQSAHTMFADYAGGRGASEFFPQAFQEAGGTHTGETPVPLGTSDFAPYFQDVQNSDADIVYSFFAGGDAINFIQNYRDFGIEKPLLGEGWLTAPNLLGPLGESALGIRSALHYVPNLENEANQQFTANYGEQFDSGANVMSVQSYDGAELLNRVVAETGGFGPDEFAQVATDVSIESPRGPLEFSEATHEPIQNQYVSEVVQQDGEITRNILDTIELVESPTWGCDLS